MNNPYQNRPPQMINQGHVPHHYDQRGPHIQQGPGADKSNPQYHHPQMNMPSHGVPAMTPQAQLFNQYANSANQQPQSVQYPQGNQMYFPPPHPQGIQNGLIPPPQLRQERDHDDTIDQQKVSNIVRQSNEKQNQNENEIEVRDILWGEQEQANVFWEQKFFLIYEKFQWFGSRFQMLKSEYISLSEQLLSVDSEEDWNQLKRQHEEFAEKLQEMFQELIAVADENQQLINQRLEEDDGVWQKRYHQLLSNFKALQEKTSMLEGENQDLKTFQQNDTQQQQGNYPELLSHYRNLEEEYEKLYTAYNKLQEEYEIVKSSPNSGNGPSLEDFENMRMEYQRTLEAIQGENDQLKGDCQGFYEENEHLKEQLQLQSQAYGETQQLAKALHEKEGIAMSLNAELQEWKRNYEQLQHQLNELVQRESAKAQEIIIQLENQMAGLKQELSTKDSQYVIISKKLEEQLKTREQLIHEHHHQLTKTVKLESDKHLRQKQALQKEIKTLHEENEALQKLSSQKEMNRYQIQSVQKRLTFMKQQNEQLLEEIKSKNLQLSALRNVSLQLTTYENILEQYKSLQREKLSLEEVSRKQHSELLQTKKRLNETQHEFEQFKMLASSSTMKSSTNSQVKHLQQELSVQLEQASKLQSEGQKFRQLLEAKEKYISELQEQNKKSIIKVEHLSRLLDNSQHDHQTQVQLLERKIDSLQKRNKANQLQFRTEVIENYEREIKELRRSNEDKLKRVKKLQEQIHQITVRSSHLQRFSSSNNNELSLLHNKINSLQGTNNDLLSKLTLARQSVDSLQKQLQSAKDRETTLKTQLNSYSIQIQEADNLIKNKNGVIVDLEGQVKVMVEKVNGLEGKLQSERKDKLEKVKKLEEETDKLKERLYSGNNSTGNNFYRTDSRRQSLSHQRYGSSYSNRYISFGPTRQQPQNQQITKIQTTLIEQINEENTKLRQQVLELTKKINSLESLSRIVAQNIENSPTKSQKSKISIQNSHINGQTDKDTAQVTTYLEERLLRFNQRLEHCIQDNNLITVRDVDLTASQRIANHERDKREMEMAYEKQIKALKDQIATLEKQLTNQTAQAPAAAQLMESDIKEFDKYQIMNEQAEKSTAESLEFLRNKLTQQEKTNSILIKLNEELKRQLEESFQKSSHSTTEYYKLQWKESEKGLEEQRQKNKKLSDQNKRLNRQNVQHDTKLMKEYQLKLFNLELHLKEVQRENSYLKLLKAKADNQKANLMHDVNVYSADIETIKASTQNKVVHYEKLANQLRDKCQSLEKELYELNGVNRSGNNSNSRTVLGSGSKRLVLA